MHLMHDISPKWIPRTSSVSVILCKEAEEPALGLYSIPVEYSGVDAADEFCIAGGEGEGCGWFVLTRESRQHQSMTSDACAMRILLCGSAVEMSATRYLRAPRTESVYARAKLDEIRTRVLPSEGLSKAKRNISADRRLRSIEQSGQRKNNPPVIMVSDAFQRHSTTVTPWDCNSHLVWGGIDPT